MNYIFTLHGFSHCSQMACLTPVCSLHGLAVTTVEGIGSVATRLHPIQVGILQAAFAIKYLTISTNKKFARIHRAKNGLFHIQ